VVINVQATASQTLCTGSTLTLSVTSTGTGLSYQWKYGPCLLDALPISFTIPSVVTGSAGNYTVDVISSGACLNTATSAPASVVTINTPATITAQPTATQTLCTGSALNLSVTATGTGLSYQWQKDGVDIG